MWKNICSQTKTTSEPSIKEALERAKVLAKGESIVEILVAGSLQLVGGALYLLQDLKEEDGQAIPPENGC